MSETQHSSSRKPDANAQRNLQRTCKLDPLPLRLSGMKGTSARAPLAFNSFLDSESSHRLVFHCWSIGCESGMTAIVCLCLCACVCACAYVYGCDRESKR